MNNFDNWTPRFIVAFTLVLSMLGCTSGTNDSNTVRFWHFWSEPAQRKQLEHLVHEFEEQHPNIHVELTALNWSDGKAKLQLAFNSGSQPDVVHLGWDWFEEFDQPGVFAPLTSNVKADVGGSGKLWCVNARALIQNKVSTTRFSWGLCATDAHNVIKRVLPLIWMLGAPDFFTRLPISETMDDSLVSSLWNIAQIAQNGALIERSRQLDERLLNAEVQQVFTGSWIIDQIDARKIESLQIKPVRSILNGDVLTMSAKCKVQGFAHQLIEFLTSYENASRFCNAVSDAGFPADINKALLDKSFTDNPLKRGFLETALLSKPLPTSKNMLTIEPIIEDMIVRSYSAKTKDDVMMIVASGKLQVASLE